MKQQWQLRCRYSLDCLKNVHSFLSGECLLTRYQFENGGATILVRSLWMAFVISSMIVLCHYVLQPTPFSWRSFTNSILETYEICLAVFGAVYGGLYARFASQWTYLATTYHQIKAVESQGSVNLTALAEWKAAFLEDADELHLASKRIFATVIRAWGHDRSVKSVFLRHAGCNASDGKERFRRLMHRVRRALRQ